jgi:hypothetical protein
METDNVIPRFYMDAAEDAVASQREGRPIFTEVEMVEVLIPGDRLSKPVFPVEDKHRERWPQHYEAFKRKQSVANTGTPVDMWPQVTTPRAMELKALNIFTVEALANLPDGMVGNIGMDGRALREKARAYIDAAAGGATVAGQAAEIARLRDMVEALMQRSAAPVAPAPAPEPRELSIDEASDDELKAFIKARTGQAPRGNVSRETLEQRATELAEQEAA